MRWYTSRWPTFPARQGTNWAALAPVPITATRRPSNSTESSQAAEWNEGPPNVSRPARAGNEGRLSWPTAHTIASNAWARSDPSPPRTVNDHAPASSSKRASVTSDEKRMQSPSPSPLAIRCRYASRSGCAENRETQSLVWAKEKL